jgi:bacillopeptidase F
MLVSVIWESKITKELKTQMENASPGEKISCIVIMNAEYPYDEVRNLTISERISLFKNIAETSQEPVIRWLESTASDEIEICQRYWVVNGFHLKATPRVIKILAKREDVKGIFHNGKVHIVATPSPDPPISTRAIEWNIQKVVADSCWNRGYTGEGVIIGITDTGVEHTHPALQGKWAGYWHVSAGLPPSNEPYDDNGHGTHCMGTILGGDGFGSFPDDIGVAPGARFAAAKVLNSGGSGSYDQCLEGLQFMADLKDSVDIEAVSNSWSGSNAADTFFYPVMRTYVSIGIVPVFANGNNGPGPGTVGCPGSYSNNIGVGATDINDDIADFSSRGPAPDQPPFNDPSTWLRDDWNLTKPQISAPGVNIRSCVPGGGYQNMNGTSMATPHVAGAIAIMCQKNPTLDVKTIYSILIDNVDEPPQGVPYPNNTYGWGRLNVWKALQATPTINQPYISVIQRTIDDPPPGGNGNGILEPGETAQLVVTLKNVGGANAYNTQGTVVSYDNYLSIQNETHIFGDLPPEGTASNSGSPYLLTAHDLTPPGHVATYSLIIHADGDSIDFDDTLDYTIQIGTPPPPITIWEEDFEYAGGIDSFTIYWTPTGNWTRTDQNSHSPTHSAYSGAPLDDAWTLTLNSTWDLTNLNNPTLSLWHSYDFESGIFLDDASIQISTNGGSTWTDLWAYNWLQGNTLPWTEEVFDLSNYISNNVKIRFLIDAYTFFQDYTDWWIDDIKLFVPDDNEPPYFNDRTVLSDTGYTGPFTLQANVTDNNGVDSVWIFYRVNSGQWIKVPMTPQGNDWYQGEIPQQNLGDVVDYYYRARDKFMYPNEGSDPVGAPDYGYYSFQIVPVSVSETKIVFPRISILNSGKLNLKLILPNPSKANINIYDPTGRKVLTLYRGLLKTGTHSFTVDSKKLSSNVYFLKIKLGKEKKLYKFVIVK